MFKQAFIVFNPQRVYEHPPRYQHPDYLSAANEAERLARENPGVEFHVMASVEVKVKRDIDTHQFDITNFRGTPF